MGGSGGGITTEDARDLAGLGPTGSCCLALLAKVLPATPGDLDLWCAVELRVTLSNTESRGATRPSTA